MTDEKLKLHELQARIEELESAIVVHQATVDEWVTDNAAIQAFLDDNQDVRAITINPT